MLKKGLLLAAVSLATFSACNKAPQNVTTATEQAAAEFDLVMKGGGSGNVTCPPVTYCGETTTVRLMAGQHTNSGNVLVGNDGTNLYVTYTGEGWRIKELHLYAGPCDGIPRTNSGNPSPGQFPNKVSFSGSGVTTYTFTIPLSNFSSCAPDICVAAHAVVNGCGRTETAWGEGCRINEQGNWAMRFNYSIQSCD